MGVVRRLGGAAGALFSATIVASVLTGGAAQAATTYVVDNTNASCLDTGAGSPAQPFCTIAAAAAKAVAGDTVQVNGGPYVGTSVDPANSGTAGNPITFTASAGVTISGGTRAFSLSSRNYIVINGFTVTGTSSYGIYVATSNNDVVTNNTVSFAGLPVSGSAMVGIYLNGLTGGTVSGNVTHDNSSHGIELTTTTTGVTVKGNTSYRNAFQYQRAAVGIEVQGPGNSIIGNLTYSNEDSGIEVLASNTLVSDNVSYGNGDHGIDNRNLTANVSITGGQITGNTVYFNCTDGINVEGLSDNYVIENNIAVDNATGAIINPTPINPVGAYTNDCNRRTGNIGVYDSAPATATANYNLVWQHGAGVEYEWGGTSYATQAALNAATGQEAHGIFADPKFANAGTFDLQLTEGSPAIDSADSGASGEQATDLLGNPRVNDPATPNTGTGQRTYDDRGAYEFQTSAALIGPTASLTVSPGSGKAPLTVTVDASGSTAGSLPITGYSFDFGDGTTAGPQAAASISHTYTTAGNYTVTVTVTDANDVASTASQSVTAAAPAGSAYVPVGPVRVLDTRNAIGHSGAVGPNGTISLQVDGVAGVPASGVTAVVLNVTVVNPTAASYVTVYPDGTARPNASNLNFTRGQTIPNLVVVPVGADGKVDFYNHVGSVSLVADLAGYYTSGTGSSFVPAGPARVLDTRNAIGHSGAVGPNGTISLQVDGVAGVPATGVTAVVLNVTVVNPTAASYVTVFPDGTARPNASNLNFSAGQTIPNLVIVPVGADGKVDFYNHSGSVSLVADLAGYYTSGTGSSFVPAGPARVLDTRNAIGHSGAVGPNGTISLQVDGVAGVPASGVTAVVLNVTVVNPTAASYVTVFPDGIARPNASNLNFSAGQTIPNLVIVPVGADGKVDFYNHVGSVSLVADLAGYYTSS